MSVSNQDVKVVVTANKDESKDETEMKDIKKEEKEEKEENKVDVTDISNVLKVCGKATAALNGQQIDKNNIIPFLHSIMEAVETFKDIDKMTGEQKKELAMKCIHWLVNNHSSLSDIAKQELDILIDQLCPPAIDLIINVAKGVSQLINTKCNSCCTLM